VLVVFPAMWTLASSGLETGLTFAWLGGCLLVLATWAAGSDRLRSWAAALLGLGPLIRPEFTLLSLGFVGVVLGAEWAARRWPARAALVAAAFAVPVAYEVFRMGYYASLVPNSALAKEGFGSYWSSGLDYLSATVIDTYALWVPLCLLAGLAYLPLLAWLRTRRQRRGLLVTAVFALGGIVEAIYIVRVGGDFIHARLLLPALFLVVSPVAVVPTTRRFLGVLLVVPWALVVLVALRSNADQPYVPYPSQRNAITVEDFGHVLGPPRRPWFTGAGAYFAPRRLRGQPARATPAVALYAIGIVGYALGPNVYVLDLFGLGDPFTSHLKLPHRGIVAHEKQLPAPWIVARLLRPGAPVRERNFPLARFSPPIDDPASEPFANRVSDARRALRCQRLSDFFATYEAPLSISRFVDNLGASFANLGFRIPPEPRQAIAELCS
jgi:arabinofuranosyltransferase